MSLFYPCYRFRRIWEITPEWFADHQISVVLLDVDNTLTTHDNPEVPCEARQWIAQIQKAGIKLLVLSNNRPERVEPFASQLGLGCIANAAKPLTGSVRRASERLGVQRQGMAIVGDQIFTDVLCGNLAGIVSILVEPIELEPFLFFKLKRAAERAVLRGDRRKES